MPHTATLVESQCDPTTNVCTANPTHGSCECYPAYLSMTDGDLMGYPEWREVVSTPDD